MLLGRFFREFARLNFRRFTSRQAAWPRAFGIEGWNGLKTSFNRSLARWRTGGWSWNLFRTNGRRMGIRAEQVSSWFCWGLALAIAGCAAYWLMRMVQVPFPSAVSAKGVVFYEAATGQTVRTLFGEKSFDPSRLVLRGVVITGTDGGVNQGMALIEVDGNPAEAVS